MRRSVMIAVAVVLLFMMTAFVPFVSVEDSSAATLGSGTQADPYTSIDIGAHSGNILNSSFVSVGSSITLTNDSNDDIDYNVNSVTSGYGLTVNYQGVSGTLTGTAGQTVTIAVDWVDYGGDSGTYYHTFTIVGGSSSSDPIVLEFVKGTTYQEQTIFHSDGQRYYSNMTGDRVPGLIFTSTVSGSRTIDVYISGTPTKVGTFTFVLNYTDGSSDAFSVIVSDPSSVSDDNNGQDPSEPAGPSDPVDPSEPTDSSEPTEPTDPSSSGPVTVDQGEKTVWSLTADFDIGDANQIQTVLWDFGFNDSDGQPVTSTEFSPRGIVFPGVGDYIVTLTMTNTIGSTVNHLLVHMMGDPFVFFETNGGTAVSGSPLGISFGSMIPVPSTVYEGHVLEGWYKDEQLTLRWDFDNDVVRETMTLYAKWDIVSEPSVETVTVTFVGNGVDLQVTSAEIRVGEHFVAPLLIRDGYVFDGWYTTEDFQDGSKYTETWIAPQTDVTFYAKWVPVDDAGSGQTDYVKEAKTWIEENPVVVTIGIIALALLGFILWRRSREYY